MFPSLRNWEDGKIPRGCGTKGESFTSSIPPQKMALTKLTKRLVELSIPRSVHRNPLDGFHFYSQPQLLQLGAQVLTINKIDGHSAFTCRLLCGFPGERASSNKQAFVSPAHHRAPEIPYLRRADAALVTFALENHMEAQHSIDAGDPFTIDSPHLN